MLTLSKIPFTKYSGTGNTFLLIQRNSFSDEELALLAKQMCNTQSEMSSDGLLVLSPSSKGDFSLRIFNRDGSFASMCGNGLRCACFHYYKKINHSSSALTIETDAGILSAQVLEEKVCCKLFVRTPPFLSPCNGYNGYFSDTGVPHYVIEVSNIEKIDIEKVAPSIRNHKQWGEKGVNVNFVERIDRKTLKIRTFERGVEAETLACGTGCAAAFLTFFKQELVEKEASLIVRSNETLLYEYLSSDEISMTGAVTEHFSGQWHAEEK